MNHTALLGAIDRAIDRGDHVDDIDELLICREEGLTSDQQAAIWLYAFARHDQRQPGRMVSEHLSAVGL